LNMAINHYFQDGNTSGTTAEQRLVEDLVIESLKIYGHLIYYLPRTSVQHDALMQEDLLNKFTQAYPLEMYLSNVEGWDGNREMFTKFGIEVRDKANFVVSRRRWESAVGDATTALQLPARPAEGDLLFFPKTKAIFEILYVDHLNPFYQLGKFYIYNLQCEMFQYSSEEMATGIEDIDNIYNPVTPEIVSPLKDNTTVETESDTFIDFTEINPFGRI
jgi:hypothetical protein